MDWFFFAPPEAFSPTGHVVLPPEESKHAVKVLRLQPGVVITVVDGQGRAAQVQIEQADQNAVRGHVLSTQQNLGEPVYELTIGLALLKQQKRFSMFLEKAVELGVTAIIPLLTERGGESRKWRKDRAIQVMTSALKQCNRSRLPVLHPPTPLREILGPGVLMADPNTDAALRTAIHEEKKSLKILVGPEGGFTENERQVAINSGATLVRLGPRRLRAETAAICCAVAVVLADKSGT